jgi:ABC-2 type transport system permease protein
MLLLQLRNELWKLFGKQRTYIGFGALLLAQVIIVLLFRYSHASHDMIRQLETNGYEASQYITSLTIATIMLFPIAYILLPLYVCLIGGDLVAKEAEDGTLRMILSRPISRFRLLFVKWLAGVIFSWLLVIMLGLVGVGFASCYYPWGGLFAFVPGEIFSVLDASSGLWHYAGAHLLLAVTSGTLLSLSFMFSCFNVKPAAATILALSVIFVSFVLMQIPFFKDLQPWFLNHYLNVWQNLLAQPVPWWKVGESLCILAGFNVTFLVIGITAFHVRDIKS